MNVDPCLVPVLFHPTNAIGAEKYLHHEFMLEKALTIDNRYSDILC